MKLNGKISSQLLEFEKQLAEQKKEESEARKIRRIKKYYQEHKEKIAEYSKQYHQENKEKYKERYKRYYQENKEKYKDYCKWYYQENKEKCKDYGKRYYQENKEKILEYSKKYSTTQSGRASNLCSSYQQNDNKMGRGDCTLKTDWVVNNILNSSCIYCGEADWRKLGCDRIDNSKPHTPDNVVCCCADCNRKKHIQDFETFLYKSWKIKFQNN